jgi:lysine biosynthesis protein LysW
MITCPLCGTDLDIEEDELDEGDVFNCDECAGSIRVASTGPLELEAEEEKKFAGGDDDDDFEDDEEEEEDEFDEDEEEDEEEEDEEDDWN